MNGKERDKIRGSLLAGAAGDALGYQIEFTRNVKDKQVTGFLSGKGRISDDTQMTLFTANALLYRVAAKERGKLISEEQAIYLSYLDWLETQNGKRSEFTVSRIKSCPELHKLRHPGNTCLTALGSGICGTLEKPINASKGCGTVMRVAPIGLFYEDAAFCGLLSAKSGAVTHGHELGNIPCMLEGILLNILLHEETTFEKALGKALDIFRKESVIFSSHNVKYFSEMTDKAIALAAKNLSDPVAIKEIGEGWVAEEAFCIALYACLKYSDNLTDALIASVNHDGDSDSTGAVTGNILGAYLGENAISEHFLNVELRELITELADDLSEAKYRLKTGQPLGELIAKYYDNLE